MALKSKIKTTGDVRLVLTDAQGRVKLDRLLKNLVVDTGLGFMASRMVGSGVAAMSHMALGSGTTATGAGQSALVTELGRVALTAANAAGKVVTYTASFGAGVGTGPITEAGIFNSAAAGLMLNRAVFAVVNKAAGDTLAITWTVTLAGA